MRLRVALKIVRRFDQLAGDDGGMPRSRCPWRLATLVAAHRISLGRGWHRRRRWFRRPPR